MPAEWSTSFKPPGEVKDLLALKELIQQELDRTLVRLDEAMRLKDRLEAKAKARRGR